MLETQSIRTPFKNVFFFRCLLLYSLKVINFMWLNVLVFYSIFISVFSWTNFKLSDCPFRIVLACSVHTSVFTPSHSAEILCRSVLSRWHPGTRQSRRGNSILFLRIPEMFNSLLETMWLVSGRREIRSQSSSHYTRKYDLEWKLVLAQERGDGPKVDEIEFLPISNFLRFLDPDYMLTARQKLQN